MIAKIIVFHFTGQGRPPRLNREELIGLRNSFQDALEVLQKVLGSPAADPVIAVN